MARNTGIDLTLNLNTKRALRAARGFFGTVGRLARTSASAINAGSSPISPRALGGSGIIDTAASQFLAPAVGTISSGVLGSIERMGTAAFSPVIKAFNPLVARNEVHNKLQPIAEAQAIATGGIDKKMLSRLQSQFQEIEERRRAGATALTEMMGNQEIDDLPALLRDLIKSIKSLVDKLGFPR